MPHAGITRRDWIVGTSAAVLSGYSPIAAAGATDENSDRANPLPKIAGVVTAYERGLHADVLIGKIIEGWRHDGGAKPALQLASLYVEQFTERDISRELAARYQAPIMSSIEGAITLGTNQVAVDGVISVGEHGDYPWNDKGQHLYPRRRFFDAIADAFEKYHRVVPVFNDKHLGPMWSDALAMYERARRLKIPFMAGSSLVVTFRDPPLTIPLGSDLRGAVGIGYSGLDVYGAHALDCYQAFVERRKNAETGVEWVQCLEGDAVWRTLDDGQVDRELFEAALAVTPHAPQNVRESTNVTLFRFQYRDGLTGALFMLPEYARGNAVAVRLADHDRPLATRFEERTEPHYPHFAYLLKAIEQMMHTGRPTYPVERTLLTSGILDRVLTSRAEDHRRIATPELSITYEPVAYPNAPEPELTRPPHVG